MSRVNRTSFLISGLLVFISACATANEVATTSMEDNYRLHGAFVSLPNGLSQMNVASSEKLFVGFEDVGEYFGNCAASGMEICLFAPDTGLYFIVPGGPITFGDTWSFRRQDFIVSHTEGFASFIDVRSKEQPNDVFRFIYANGSIAAFMWGDWIERNGCKDCFVPRMSYVWVGERPFNQSLISKP